MVVIKKPIKKNKFRLPEFDLQRLLDHIQQLVDAAPHGMVALVIDLFCGAGGTSEGLEQAISKYGTKAFCIIAGINHDQAAIFSQATNHPLAYYSTEDIRTAKLEFIRDLIIICKMRFPNCPIFLWASLECTNLSNAKGGMSRDADSRTLAWDIFRYLEVLKPDGLWIENVKEFSEWGPLIEGVTIQKGKVRKTMSEPVPKETEMQYYNDLIDDGYICTCKLDIPKKKFIKTIGIRPTWIPIKSLKGTYYKPWADKVKKYGYNLKEFYLNAADFGVPQNRKRFFPIFMRKGLPIAEPKPTHNKTGCNGLKKYVPVKTCLDFDEEGESIFTPGKITAEASYKRIYLGLIKFVAGGKKEFEFMLQRNAGDSRTYSMNGPARTVTVTGGNQELIQAEHWLIKYMGNNAETGANAGKSIDEPCNTVPTSNMYGLMKADSFLTKEFSTSNNTDLHPGQSIEDPGSTVAVRQTSKLIKTDKFLDVVYGNGTPSSIDKESPSLRTKDGLQLVRTETLLVNYQGMSNANSIDDVSPTVMTQEKLALTGIKYFITNQYSGGGQVDSVDDPAATVPTVPKARVMQVVPWVINTNFTDKPGKSIEDPADTVLASRKHSYLLTSHFGGHASSTEHQRRAVCWEKRHLRF